MNAEILVPGTATVAAAAQEELKTEWGNNARHSRRQSTLSNYRAQWRMFSEWASACGRVDLPALPETVGMYLQHRAERGASLSTLRVILAGIKYAHKLGSQPLELDTDPEFARSWEGMQRNLAAVPQAKRAFMVSDLRTYIANLEATIAAESTQPGTRLQALRDRAILLLGHSTACRRSELAGLDVWQSDGAAGWLDFDGTDLFVVLWRHKTSGRSSDPRRILVAPTSSLCAVTALREWLEATDIESGPVFRTMSRDRRVQAKRMTGEDIARAVKKAVKYLRGIAAKKAELADAAGDAAAAKDARADLDRLKPEAFGAHSLRAGFITAADAAGVSIGVIKDRAGHASVATTSRYLRPKQDAKILETIYSAEG